MATKHVCKHCGARRSGHDCKVAGRKIEKADFNEFVPEVIAPPVRGVRAPDGSVNKSRRRKKKARRSKNPLSFDV